MPRKSAASLAVVPGLRTIPRLRPPRDLTPLQRSFFAHIVASKPADWFQASDLPLLVLLCRHLARADQIEEQLRLIDPMYTEAFDALARMADRESQRIAMLMTRLRLTPQSRYRPDSGKAAASGRGDPIDVLLSMEDHDD